MSFRMRSVKIVNEEPKKNQIDSALKTNYNSKSDTITLCSIYRVMSYEKARLLTFHVDGGAFKLKNIYFIVNSLTDGKTPLEFTINITPISGNNKETTILTEISHQVAKGFNLFELDFLNEPKIPKEIFIIELQGRILDTTSKVELLSVQTHLV